MKITLVVAAGEVNYQADLLGGLSKLPDVEVDIIGRTELAEMAGDLPHVRVYPFRGRWNIQLPRWLKLFRQIRYFILLIGYILFKRSDIIHVQWFSGVPVLDRTLMLWLYRITGRKVMHTAHNLSYSGRDGKETEAERRELSRYYQALDAVIVHTKKMKSELVQRYEVEPSRVHVIEHGINLAVPRRGIGMEEARKQLGLQGDDPLFLFFGNIAPYKGLDLLVNAYAKLLNDGGEANLFVVGSAATHDAAQHWRSIQENLAKLPPERVTTRIEYIPTEDIETCLAAADCLVLPYRGIYQSGVLLLAWTFGLPVIVSDVGSLRDYVEELDGGLVCNPEDVDGLTSTLEQFLADPRWKRAEEREALRIRAGERFDWDVIAGNTAELYRSL